MIRRAFINADARGVLKKGRLRDAVQAIDGIAGTVAEVPIHPIICPTPESSIVCLGADKATAVVVHQLVVIVGVVLHPGEHQLPGIIHTVGRLPFDFCLIQGGQQHRRKNCDDGNHHQQFYQRKSLALL